MALNAPVEALQTDVQLVAHPVGSASDQQECEHQGVAYRHHPWWPPFEAREHVLLLLLNFEMQGRVDLFRSRARCIYCLVAL
jgi:hypothetical protein